MNVEYKIKEWSKDCVSLVRYETREIPIVGLSPINSQSIVMYKTEIQQIMETLKEYANKN